MKKQISTIELLDFSLGAEDVKESQSLSALQNHYVREVQKFGIDKIYFSGELPAVYFIKVSDFNEEAQQIILNTHKNIWNQGKVPLLYVESDLEIRVYNCYEKPVKFGQGDRAIDDLEIYRTALSDLKVLKQVFGQVSIETGQFWKEKEFAQKIDNNSRVEAELIKNLKKTRGALKEDLPISMIHNLLLRSLFILYLEDRGATDASYYHRITGSKEGDSFFQILGNKENCYLLFDELEDKFNGNLCPVTKDERQKVTSEHLAKIKACFWTKIQENGQFELFPDWRLFNFEIIPIQLLSEIYEEFLSVEDPKGKAKKGAFYTPYPLAEFVLNEMLPYSNSKKARYNIKTLDPTCGSGIFLVESLNRLLDRWTVAHPEEKLSFKIICQIVQDNIFGIEINSEAIKVAAFSIYLTMLNRLNPKKLWQNKRFPYLIFDPDEKDTKKQGGNLFRMSSLEKEPLNEVEIVVGNPPFSRGGLEKKEQAYLDCRGYARELVLAFLHRVTVLAPNAKYGLICGSKPVLFNNGDPYQNFRRFLFNDNYVEKVYNFSILRRGSKKEGSKNLFASAVSPISVIFYTRKTPIKPSPKLMYCAPKTAIKKRLVDGIVIDPTDVKYLPREECQKPNTKIWKVAMWGTERDFILISKFQTIKTIEKISKEKEWENGGGFELSSKKYRNSFIKSLPHLGTNTLERYYTLKNVSTTIHDEFFHRFGNLKVYQAPHLLIKEGQKNKKYCASFIDYDCSFKKTVHAIHSPNSSELKLVGAYLNSELAAYIMFLTTSDWGIERERVIPKDMLLLPFLPESFDKKTIKAVIFLFDQIIKIRASNPLNEKELIADLEQKIENAIWNGLDFSKVEKIIIEDFLIYVLDSFQNKQKSIAFNPNNIKENQQYATHLCQTINQFLGYESDLTVWSSVFELSPRIPLNVTILYFNNEKKADYVKTLPEKQIAQVLKDMEKYSYKEHAESIYFRRFLRYYTNDRLYIIKPNEKRFWSRSMAINDADEIIAEIATQ